MYLNESLPQCLKGIIEKLSDGDFCKTLDVVKGRKLLCDADVTEKDVLPFADFDYPTRDCYGRKIIYDGGHFELLVMSWNPGAYSSIHTHGGAEWGTVQVFGKAHHIIYNIKNDVLEITKKEITDPNCILEIDADFIHQMGNPTSERFISLHIYCSSLVTNNITAYAQNFDIEFDRISFTTGGAFFNLPEENIHYTKKGVRTSKEAFIHYATVLLQYYSRQKNTPEIAYLKENLIRKIQDRLYITKTADLLLTSI